MSDLFNGRTFFIVKAPHEGRNDEDADFDLTLDKPDTFHGAHIGVLFDGKHVAQAVIDRLNAFEPLSEEVGRLTRERDELLVMIQRRTAVLKECRQIISADICPPDGQTHVDYEWAMQIVANIDALIPRGSTPS
jgi:hypothetical protein